MNNETHSKAIPKHLLIDFQQSEESNSHQDNIDNEISQIAQERRLQTEPEFNQRQREQRDIKDQKIIINSQYAFHQALEKEQRQHKQSLSKQKQQLKQKQHSQIDEKQGLGIPHRDLRKQRKVSSNKLNHPQALNQVNYIHEDSLTDKSTSSMQNSMYRFINKDSSPQKSEQLILDEFNSQLDIQNYSKNADQISRSNKHQQQQQSLQSYEGSPQKLHLNKKGFPSSLLSLSERSNISLVSPPSRLKKQCHGYNNKLFESLNNPNEQNHSYHINEIIHEFIHKPLHSLNDKFMRYTFQIHFYKYTFSFHTYYQLWYTNQQGQMIQLLKSEKDSLSISSSHMIYMVDFKDAQNQKKKRFVAKLKYNTAKTEYNMYDIDEKENPNKPRKFIASAVYSNPINDERKIDLYVPKAEYINNDFIKSAERNNLKSFIQQDQSPMYRKIHQISTSKNALTKQQQNDVREEFNLKKTGRNMLLCDEQGNQKLFFGKRQEQRYIVLSADGLSPLQIFTAAIVNLDH